MGDPDYVLGGNPAPNPHPARIERFDANGAWLGDLAYSGFDEVCSGGTCEQWSPRGIVVGPDGALYVSGMHFVSTQNPSTLPGRIFRIDASGGVGIFVDGAACGCDLARPDGLVFGPDGTLYATSFRRSASDNDKILAFDGTTGAYKDRIDLDVAGQPRAYAQALLFGPGQKLYVPISGNGPDTGSVRRYNVRSKAFTVFVAAGPLGTPFYLTFGNTDPATLAYGSD
jgi:hypothetical protein